ncbi:MAG: monovalent cation/H(+) antiporter subunit G [Bacillota bacterium]
MSAAVVVCAAYTLMLAGAFFCVSSVIGILRFPDVYTRMHAGTKGLTAGAFLVLLGAAPLYGSAAAALKVLVIVAFFLVTNPVATHAIARACYAHGIKPGRSVVDHYEEYKEGRKGV